MVRRRLRRVATCRERSAPASQPAVAASARVSRGATSASIDPSSMRSPVPSQGRRLRCLERWPRWFPVRAAVLGELQQHRELDAPLKGHRNRTRGVHGDIDRRRRWLLRSRDICGAPHTMRARRGLAPCDRPARDCPPDRREPAPCLGTPRGVGVAASSRVHGCRLHPARMGVRRSMVADRR